MTLPNNSSEGDQLEDIMVPLPTAQSQDSLVVPYQLCRAKISQPEHPCEGAELGEGGRLCQSVQPPQYYLLDLSSLRGE